MTKSELKKNLLVIIVTLCGFSLIRTWIIQIQNKAGDFDKINYREIWFVFVFYFFFNVTNSFHSTNEQNKKELYCIECNFFCLFFGSPVSYSVYMELFNRQDLLSEKYDWCGVWSNIGTLTWIKLTWFLGHFHFIEVIFFRWLLLFTKITG